MDQSEGRILYHMTGFTASVFLEVWDRVFWWGLVPLGQHGIEASGSDVMASGRDVIKPEVTSWENLTVLVYTKTTIHLSVGG